MKVSFSIPGGYVQRSLVRPRRYYYKNYENAATGYIGWLRARLLWHRLGKPTN
jgi:hypothetical protein